MLLQNWCDFVLLLIRASVIKNWGSFILLQIGASVITNQGSYYKLAHPLLQIVAAITNWDKLYYKLGQLLQIGAIITNWGVTVFTLSLKTFNVIWKGQLVFRYRFKGILSNTASTSIVTSHRVWWWHLYVTFALKTMLYLSFFLYFSLIVSFVSFI